MANPERTELRRWPSRVSPLPSFRRSACLIVYWRGDALTFENYAKGTKVSADPLTCSILHYCNQWRTLEQISEFLQGFERPSVSKNLKMLCKTGLLDRSDKKQDPREKAMESWASWSPGAAFFHFSTRDVAFTNDPWGSLKKLMRRTRRDPMPLPVKHYPGAPTIKLPETNREREFEKVLRSRRTWRIYGKEDVPLETLAQLLKLTFGVQGWVDVPGLGRAAMKTSPSCGCLHPIEAYVLAQRVDGLQAGIYHYDAARHMLEWLRAGIARKALEESLGFQWWFAKGAFLVLMTAVFARTRWKYQYPRVYRGILIEAGHLCQTFCLTATWLGLAPFSTMAQNESKWEKWLGLDGVNESVVYVAGAGRRPKTDVREAHMGLIGKKATRAVLG